MKSYFKLIRVHQWVKNLFVFLPLFFAGQITNLELFMKSILGFILFSLTASSIYIINDYFDIEKDKEHPTKKNRPLASGKISKNEAVFTFVLLILTVVILSLIIRNKPVLFTLVFYFILNVMYSFKLKRIPILDVMIIAFGFLLRVFVGGYITGIKISDWTILLVFTLALVLALGKRRGELVNTEIKGKTRESLGGYNIQFIDSALAVACTVAIVSYMMYIFSNEVQSRLGHPIVYSFIFVFIAVLRYLQQTMVFEKTESPTSMVFKDTFLQILGALWMIFYAVLIYFKSYSHG